MNLMGKSKGKTKPAPSGASGQAMGRLRLPVWLLAVLLGATTVAVYWPATRCDFINYDEVHQPISGSHPPETGLCRGQKQPRWSVGNEKRPGRPLIHGR